MFSISCEQFQLATDPEAPDGVTIVMVQNYTAVPVADPRSPTPQRLPIATCSVVIVLNEAQRAELHAMTAPREVVADGEPRPESGVVDSRCGRLQSHPSHVYEAGGAMPYWCDGQPPFMGMTGGYSDSGEVQIPDVTAAPAYEQVAGQEAERCGQTYEHAPHGWGIPARYCDGGPSE